MWDGRDEESNNSGDTESTITITARKEQIIRCLVIIFIVVSSPISIGEDEKKFAKIVSVENSLCFGCTSHEKQGDKCSMKIQFREWYAGLD